LFLTNDDRMKILDFGLAKLTRPENDAGDDAPTVQVNTEPGQIMGTVGYMSPEQVRGKAADHRSDIFSFGSILYEMLSGQRAFRGDTPADTMSAILKEEPAELSETARNVPPALERMVRHCLEKNPAQRFQSAGGSAASSWLILGSRTTDIEILSREPDSRRPPLPFRNSACRLYAAGRSAMCAIAQKARPAGAGSRRREDRGSGRGRRPVRSGEARRSRRRAGAAGRPDR